MPFEQARAYINRVESVVPPHEVHAAFIRFARASVAKEKRAAFERLADRAQIGSRFSVLPTSRDETGETIDEVGFYRRGRFPTTSRRMALYERHALELAVRAVEKLELADPQRVSHLILTSCTGFVAPGIDLALLERCGLSASVERTLIGFMGCSAAVNALKLARHIVRSEPGALVLCINVELCTLHLQESEDLEELLTYLQFGDGCAAALVSAEASGLSLDRFCVLQVPATSELITWRIGDRGFDMFLSGQVPRALKEGLAAVLPQVLDGARPDEIRHWGVHPGGRSVLDAVSESVGLDGGALRHSRAVLLEYGNMSSATLMFVLQRILRTAAKAERGCAMAFGPGIAAETFLFHRE